MFILNIKNIIFFLILHFLFVKLASLFLET